MNKIPAAPTRTIYYKATYDPNTRGFNNAQLKKAHSKCLVNIIQNKFVDYIKLNCK